MTTRVQRHNLQPWKEERAPVSRNRIPGALSRGRNKHFASTDYAITQRGPGRNQSWLQRSQIFIGPLLTKRPALQRSAMFPTTTAQVEQVSLLWSEGNPFGVARVL